MRSRLVLALSASFLAAAVGTANADDTDSNAHVEGIVNGTYQAASGSRVNGQDVDGEGNGELYLLGTLDMGPGGWVLEVRGSTTPRDHGVTSFYGSNALVGETVDSDGDGRIAATQLYYQLPAGPGKLRVGLIDPTAFLDANEIADDEYAQFLAGAFVNNPTIGFPSYVLGGAYKRDATGHLDYKLFVASDSGLQEDDASYHNVFDIGGDRADGTDKGAFTQAELNWHASGYALQAGVWYDTSDVPRLDDSSGGENAYGFYASAGAPLGSGRVQGRAGIANDDAQAAANFVSLAYQLPIQLASRETALGLGIARTGDSDALPFDSDPINQVEIYWRINVAGAIYVSPDIQYINNDGFQADQDGVVIAGARAGIEF